MSTRTATQPGAVKITLHSANNDVDEKAEVTVALKHPEEAVAKMLRTLAQRFPPESVMTIQPSGGPMHSGASNNDSATQEHSGGGTSYHNASTSKPVITRSREDSPYTRASSAAGSAARHPTPKSPTEASRHAGYHYPPNAAYPSQPGSAEKSGQHIGDGSDAGVRRPAANEDASPPAGLPVFPGMPYAAYAYPPQAYAGHAGQGQEAFGNPIQLTAWPAMMPATYPPYGYPGMQPGGSPMVDASGKIVSPYAGGYPYGYAPGHAQQMGEGFAGAWPGMYPPYGYLPAGMQQQQSTAAGQSPVSGTGGTTNLGRGNSGRSNGARLSEEKKFVQSVHEGRYESSHKFDPMSSAAMPTSSPMGEMPGWAMTAGSEGMGAQSGMVMTGDVVSGLKPGFGEYVHVGPDGLRTRYVEVEVHEEREVEVPKVEVREVTKEVKDTTYETRVVEVDDPQVVEEVVYQDRVTEEERLVEVRVRKVEEVPVERVVEKVVDVRTTREEIVEVPEYVEVPKPYTVEQPVTVPRYTQREQACMVAQKLRPSIRTHGKMKVETTTYEPVLYAVDVYIPKPVMNAIVSNGKIDESHQRVNIPAAQYNSLVHKLNPALEKQVVNEVCLKTVEGHIPLLPAGELADIVAPLPGAWADGSFAVLPRAASPPRTSGSPKDKKHRKSHSHKRHHHTRT